MNKKVKNKCEKCGRELINNSGAYACSYNCTFCPQCAKEMGYVCPNCSGKLEKRAKNLVK